MGLGKSTTLFVALLVFCVCVSSTRAAEDVELKDPHMFAIATVATDSVVKNFQLEDYSLHRIVDVQVVPQAPTVIVCSVS